MSLLLLLAVEIAAPGVPGPLCVFGEHAHVVAVGGDGKLAAPVVAAGRLGKGRVVAFGHGGYLQKGALAVGDTEALVRRMVQWAGGGRILVHKNLHLRDRLGAKDWQAGAKCDVVVIDAHWLRNPKIYEAIETFVQGGGGLVTASLGWGWKQLNPGKSLRRDHAGNRLLRQAGIVWADGYLKRTSANGYRQPEKIDPALHARTALGQATPQGTQTLTRAIHAIPRDDTTFLPILEEAIRDVAFDKLRVITRKDGLARVAFAWSIEQAKHAAPKDVKAHPWAERFPGRGPDDAQQEIAWVRIDPRIPRWQSTGLYARAGDQIKIELPAPWANKGLFVRIGAHSDRLWQKKEWQRAPEISRRWPVVGTPMTIASAFGGNLYIEVPKAVKAESFAVKVVGCIRSPWFRLHTDSVTSWRAQRQHAGPWAELGTNKMIVTLPSRAIRELEDPRPVLRLWDEVMDACADLRQTSRDRASPERFVCDKQISVGYMHSGYPLMCHLDQQGKIANFESLRKGNWGLFHEVGHNHQVGDWTFAGTTEVTVNLFSLYVFETVCKSPRPRTNLYGDGRRKRIDEYIQLDRKFSHWKKKPFLALL
ncbi:MAG: M60 family metallopeptidase, partial [Planctomycetota bacterium]